MQKLVSLTDDKSEHYDSLGKTLSQIRALASVSHNIMSGREPSLYIDDVAHLLITIRDLAVDAERYKLKIVID